MSMMVDVPAMQLHHHFPFMQELLVFLATVAAGEAEHALVPVAGFFNVSHASVLTSVQLYQKMTCPCSRLWTR